MISRYEVALNDVLLSEVSENLLILDVHYTDPEITNSMVSLGNREGSFITRRRKERASVTIDFEIHEYDIAERQRVYQDIVSWAIGGGILTINDRPDMRLRCICENLPAISSVKNWTDSLSITFSAYAYPYWEDVEPVLVTLNGANARGSIHVSGNVGEAFVTAEITANEAISHLTVSVGNTSIQLTGISIPKNGVVKISYDDDAILSIKYGSTSLLSKRTPASSDDLMAKCGATNSVSVVASNVVTARISVRGCWH